MKIFPTWEKEIHTTFCTHISPNNMYKTLKNSQQTNSEMKQNNVTTTKLYFLFFILYHLNFFNSHAKISGKSDNSHQDF